MDDASAIMIGILSGIIFFFGGKIVMDRFKGPIPKPTFEIKNGKRVVRGQCHQMHRRITYTKYLPNGVTLNEYVKMNLHLKDETLIKVVIQLMRAGENTTKEDILRNRIKKTIRFVRYMAKVKR